MYMPGLSAPALRSRLRQQKILTALQTLEESYRLTVIMYESVVFPALNFVFHTCSRL